jgi:3-mercaptopyruvate sulfurtransferase SseA
MKNVKTIEPNSLAVRMEAVQRQLSSNKKNNSQFLLIDCRPFIAYNVNHIRNAINVNCCDRFNRKRLQQGKATLADLATTKEGKELLKKRSWREVVVYDDSSDSLETLPASHTLFLVMNALVEDNREPVMLLGGLRDFQVLRTTAD